MRASRREGLRAIGVTAVVIAVTTRAGLRGASPSSANTTPPKKSPSRRPDLPPVRADGALAELDGARFAGCLVHDVGAVKDGSIPVTFSDTAGEFFVVDVLRHDPATPGVARAGSLAVYMNTGSLGHVRTREEHGLAAMALAAELVRRERAGASVPVLVNLTERAAIRSSA